MTGPIIDTPITRFTWAHQYDDARDALDRAATNIRCEDVSLTQQHFAKDANLNTIVKRYGITDGAIPPAALDPQYFGDFTDAVDFREHLDRVRNATDRFNALPADIRSAFDNDPIALHEFVTDPANIEESIAMGLLKREDGNKQTPEQKAASDKERRPTENTGSPST